MADAAERSEARRHHAAFLAWLTSHGALTSNLRLEPEASGLSWRAVAPRPLPPGTTCCRIPVSVALTEDAVLASKVAADAKQLGLQPSTRALTYAFMLLQRADPTSRFGPYLRAIPARHTDPMTWTAAELALLKGSNLLPQHRRRYAELWADYDALIPALSAAKSKLCVHFHMRF